MPASLKERLSYAWNVFRNPNDHIYISYNESGASTSYRPDRTTRCLTNERSIIIAVFNRIALDIASIPIRHVRLDKDDVFLETIHSGLNNALTVEANLDQTGRAFIQDVVMSLFDEGCVAVVPVETSLNPNLTGGYDVHSLRTGQILEWYPNHVRVRVYNERKGIKEDLLLSKSMVAIIENPLYSIMNEPNSTLKRLVEKLNLLDVVDKQSGSGKLDVIIQLPYAIKTQARREQAEERRDLIANQLTDSKYGIAYADATEKITQLNRPVENNLMGQVEYLTKMLYSQLGLTEAVFTGTADEAAMLNYTNRTIAPILTAVVDEFKRKFLTKTARAQKQSLVYFTNPFSLVPASEIADIADKFTRNEILSSNEVRGIIGYKPVDDPRANELRNKNLNASDQVDEEGEPITTKKDSKGDSPNEEKRR